MDNCPVHNQPFKIIPAGISKSTGRPYPAFEACPVQGCREKPGKQTQQQQNSQWLEPTKAPEKADNDSEVWERKDKQSMAQTAMKSASEIVAAQLTVKMLDADNLQAEFDNLKEKNYKWLTEKKSAQQANDSED